MYNHMSDDEEIANALTGKTIRRVFVSEGESDLVFDTAQGRFIIGTWADCCSETWFADIIGFDALKDATVTRVECIEMPDAATDGRSRQDVDEFYGIKIYTNKGSCDIIYRNSSNGYYGGSAQIREDFDGKLTEITGDWQAGSGPS